MKPKKATMAVLIETNLGDLVIDLKAQSAERLWKWLQVLQKCWKYCRMGTAQNDVAGI